MSIERVQDYLWRGYSAERVAQLVDWPLRGIEKMKREGNFTPTAMKKEQAVFMVLKGKTIQQAAKATGLPLLMVKHAVEDAKSKIEQLTVLAEQMPRQVVVDRI